MKKKILALMVMILLFLEAPAEDITFINADTAQSSQDAVHCEGNVIIVYCNRIISADTISYDRKKEIINAQGNIIIKDEWQNVYFLDSLSVNKNFSLGEGKNVKIIMSDQSRLAAAEFLIKNGKYELKNVIYTPCYACSNLGELTWQMKALNVTFDPENYVEYRNTYFELFGTSIFHTPYFAHVSPKIKRKSGFLAPKFSVSSKNGLSVLPQYLFAISDSQELILKPIVTSKIGNVGWMYYALRFPNGEFDVDTSLTNTRSVKGQIGDNDSEKKAIKKIQDSGYRGHIFSKLKYEINDVWRYSFDINLASDSYYLKKFPFLKSIDRLLESNMKFEGFDGRNYTSVKTAMFQSENPEYTPRLLPVVERNYSRDLWNGTFGLDCCVMNLDFRHHRSARKAVSNASWEKEILLSDGHLIDFKGILSLQGEKVSRWERSGYDSSFMAKPQVNVAWKQPLVLTMPGQTSAIFTPIIGIIIAGNKKNVDFFEEPFCEINPINFLVGNKCISPYNIDSGDRIYYGLKLSGYQDGKNLYRYTMGRSTELTAIPDRFEASGLKQRNSNIVSSLEAFLSSEWTFIMNTSYSTHSKRLSNIDAGLNFSDKKICFDLMIFRGKQCAYNQSFIDYKNISEEQTTQKYKGIMFNAGWNVSSTIKLKGGVVFGNEVNTVTIANKDNVRLIKQNIGIEYKNECTTVDFIVERKNFSTGDLKPETNFQLAVHLKNLGI
ncbi:MAG: LPS assembly protein LptD [Holosporaceae bacterium]|nr:LPS assembly protein LptD [Holosporaceae bacterium]